MDLARIIMIIRLLGLCGLLMLMPITTWAADTGDGDFAKGWDLLKLKKYKEARTALESGIKKNPSNALAHFYLADACRGLKDWLCAEEHYETSLELDAKSSVADLAKARLKKAKVWRLLDEARATMADSKTPAEKAQQIQDQLEIANKLGLDDEQQAVHQQLQDKLQKMPQEMPMVLVPAGEFMMGSNQGEDNEKPEHLVYLDAFQMDRFEVTVGMYAKFLEATGIDAPPDWQVMNQPPHQKRPVVKVNWSDANTYCRWVGKRLPTEAEWEKAARGTDGRLYPWGNDPPDRLRANYGKERWNDHQALVPVGTLHDGKSPYGIYDMAGNVWEWTSDWYDENYYKNSPARNPKGPESGEYKVLRGGSWSNPQPLRSTGRNYFFGPRIRSDSEPRVGGDYEPTYRLYVHPTFPYSYGFRCAKTP